jgi:hypothetical protein
MVEVARNALKDIPTSEVLRERVSLALDRLAEAERQIATLQAEKGGLQAQLERERIDHEQTKKELQPLQELLREEIRLVCDVEFRKGFDELAGNGCRFVRSAIFHSRFHRTQSTPRVAATVTADGYPTPRPIVCNGRVTPLHRCYGLTLGSNMMQ